MIAITLAQRMFQFVGITYQATDITVCTCNNFSANIFFTHVFSWQEYLMSKRSKPVLLCVGSEFVYLRMQVYIYYYLPYSLSLILIMFGEISNRGYHNVHRDVYKNMSQVSHQNKKKMQTYDFQRALKILPNSFRNIHKYLSHWYREIEIAQNVHFSKIIIILHGWVF